MAQTHKEVIDLLVIGSHVVTMDDQWDIIENGGVAIRRETILEVGSQKKLLEKYTPKKLLVHHIRLYFQV
jgi:predicted amidohydrolase YtcJ